MPVCIQETTTTYIGVWKISLSYFHLYIQKDIYLCSYFFPFILSSLPHFHGSFMGLSWEDHGRENIENVPKVWRKEKKSLLLYRPFITKPKEMGIGQ